MPTPLASFLSPLINPSTSSLGNRSDIHPYDSISLIGIRNFSSLICPSVNINILPGLDGFATFLYISYNIPLKSFNPKLLVTTNCSISNSNIKADSFAKLCLPLPPTPINKALPTPNCNILTILQICCIACWNSTKFITVLVSLYSASFSSKTYLT